jgi:hypothetical protein
MLRFSVSWILIVLGLAVGLYWAIQLLIGVVAAVRSPELATGIGVSADGAFTFVAGP